ncbi:hypothetical protein PFLUV_G00217710 [Perca fluviatilis]|uniref:Uncharacterized protein n=1 Tax=Perca fluviatilis TaxID=8168 RepID=A0A6A5E3M5_PERFL|nr:hypothetical protein PFLUV_G00217710 [Perca fluviatilis]
MEEFSVNVGIPMNCIFPVKNHPSIHHQPLIPRTGSWGGWSQSQHTSGERPGTPWTGRQSIAAVKNYHEEINLNSDIDSLILSALTNIINFGDDCINMGKDSDSKEELLNFSIKPAPPYAKLQ